MSFNMAQGSERDESFKAPANIFCRCCGSPLVQASDWEHERDSIWTIRLWCPECGFEQAAALDRPQLLYLSLAVEEGFDWLFQALAELDAVTAAPLDFDFARRAQIERIRQTGH